MLLRTWEEEMMHYFGKDSWDNFPPLDSFNIPLNIKNILVNLWGIKVDNYKQIKWMNEEDIWM